MRGTRMEKMLGGKGKNREETGEGLEEEECGGRQHKGGEWKKGRVRFYRVSYEGETGSRKKKGGQKG